ncbi:hypothetical protein GSI_02682 [Ganoderma sinense ZZ0214-1]|uniref:DUF6534 domain-containing protein n=1 Tax=Ganoderma sinense ZZ0214-1 TaxID=1077348 RepID=A0A2G8SMA0_9APHY|nr:hypothetical protein GSI_02682 [Ganoderma sinense ZZ0214-1]
MADNSVVELDLPSILLSELKEVFGSFLVGTVLSAVVYGVSVLQAYVYFRNGGQDSKYLRFFVAFLFALDTLSMVLNFEGLYQYVVTDFGDLLSLLKLPWSMVTWYTLLISVAVDLDWYPDAVVVIALCAFALGAVSWVILCKSVQITTLHSPEMRMLWGVSSGLSVVCDILIVAGLCYYLHSKRTGFKTTDSIIDRLIIYAINRGVLTAMCQAIWLITSVALPGHFFDIPFGLLDQHLYCNTLLAT